ncbi:BPK_collapsed_G0003600.mRNA.1.CDS.1 [Saccharomyces cerevisiae]|nr:BPK_collapsed_G0003600.mRNA.1.CDS.1 [Saccharomyces cerevisiae]
MDSGFTSSHESMDKTQKQSSEWAANQKHNQRVENTRVLMGPAVPGDASSTIKFSACSNWYNNVISVEPFSRSPFKTSPISSYDAC